jgi:hypothetical protein
MRPKWLLTHPDSGLPMVLESIFGIDISTHDKVVLVALKKHEEEFKFCDKLLDICSKFDVKSFDILLLDESKSQPHTIAQAINSLNIEGQINCKDTDNYFRSQVPEGNYVAICSLNDIELVNARNKSYVEFNEQKKLINIVEKNVISNSFCAGLYGFSDAKKFYETFEKYEAEDKNNKNLFVSHIILMMSESEDFDVIEVKDYIDWGTSTEWNEYRNKFKTYFVDIDGVLVKTSSEYMSPYWGETDGIKENIKRINDLYNTGNRIILTTGRNGKYHKITEEQLTREGVKFSCILYSCGNGQRVIINDFSSSNPYPSCQAINLPRDSNILDQLI